MKLILCDNSLKELINFRGDVIKHFYDKGFSIVVIAPNTLTADANPIVKNYKIYSPKLERSGMNPIRDLGYFFKLLKIYRLEKPDLVFHYTIKPNIYGSIAAKLCGIPSVAMVTGLGYAFSHKGIKTFIARNLYRFALQFPRKVFVLNEDNMTKLLNQRILKKEQVILLYGGEGINLETFK